MEAPIPEAITDAVVPVAGLGTRLLPATRSAPKEMLPVVDKPVAQYVVEELAAAGMRRVLFVTGRRKRAIEDHFDADPELEHALGRDPIPGAGLSFLYTRQARPDGLGDALRHAEGFAGDRGVVVALGDSIIEPSPAGGSGIVSRLIEAYQSSGVSAAVAVAEVPAEAVNRYGVLVTDSRGEVVELREKPEPDQTPSRLAVMGRYVLGPEVFAALRETSPDANGEIQLTDALGQVIRDGGRIVAVALSPGERRHDIGTIEGYCTTFLEHALRHPTLGGVLRARAAELLDGRGG
jgi:UTP--glucose-1-phosphate uridylyltransferase